VEPLLEEILNQADSPEAMLNMFPEIWNDPISCLNHLAFTSKTLIMKMSVNQVRSHATAWLSQRGMEYDVFFKWSLFTSC